MNYFGISRSIAALALSAIFAAGAASAATATTGRQEPALTQAELAAYLKTIEQSIPPERECSPLFDWNQPVSFFSDRIQNTEPTETARQRLLDGLLDLANAVELYRYHENYICRVAAEVSNEEERIKGFRTQVRSHVLAGIEAIQRRVSLLPADVPFARRDYGYARELLWVRADQTTYGTADRPPFINGIDWNGSVDDFSSFIMRNVSYSPSGAVRVRPVTERRSRQTVSMHFRDGGFLERDWGYLTITEEVTGGRFRLTANFNCSDDKTFSNCLGRPRSVVKQSLQEDASFRLSEVYLKERVVPFLRSRAGYRSTDGCVKVLQSPAWIREVLLSSLPDDNPAVQDAFRDVMREIAPDFDLMADTTQARTWCAGDMGDRARSMVDRAIDTVIDTTRVREQRNFHGVEKARLEGELARTLSDVVNRQLGFGF